MDYIKKKGLNNYWRDRAACKGMEMDQFFPPVGVPYSKIKSVKAICLSCPVMLDCLEMILNTENDNYGIFGGTTPQDRRKIRSERAYLGSDFLPASLVSDYESAQALAVGGKTEKGVA